MAPTGTTFTFSSSTTETCRPVVNYVKDQAGIPVVDANGLPIPIYGDAQTVSGFRLQDGRASYGIGLETFAFGFPIHFDWSWRSLFNRGYEDVLFASSGGSSKVNSPVWGS